MMKKIIIATLATYSLAAFAFEERETLIEIKGSGFFPTSHLFKKIYHSAGMIGGEVTMSFCNDVSGWVSVDWLSKSGHSLVGDTKTKVNYLPIAFGLKYIKPFCYGDWYVGLGALTARVHTHDFSSTVAPYFTKWGWGGIVKFGALFDIGRCAFVDLFVNYSFMRASSHNTAGGTVVPHTVKVDGVIAGIGLGFRFN